MLLELLVDEKNDTNRQTRFMFYKYNISIQIQALLTTDQLEKKNRKLSV